jgi:hypothetical protein
MRRHLLQPWCGHLLQKLTLKVIAAGLTSLAQSVLWASGLENAGIRNAHTPVTSNCLPPAYSPVPRGALRLHTSDLHASTVVTSARAADALLGASEQSRRIHRMS